jgi:3-oxoacyl-[acyl-carrier protein] reductase
MAQKVDVRDGAACEAAVERLVEQWQAIDVLVNNAGVTRDNLLGLLADADVRTVLDTNVGGAFNVTRAVVPHMMHRRSGAIVNLSSVAAGKGGRGQTTYAASKGALEAFTRALAVELAPRGIRVNAVSPGVIDTAIHAKAGMPDRAERFRALIPMGRAGSADEVARVILWLLSDEASYVTGALVPVGGGR